MVQEVPSAEPEAPEELTVVRVVKEAWEPQEAQAQPAAGVPGAGSRPSGPPSAAGNPYHA